MHAGDAVWRIWGHVAYLNKVGQPLLALDLQNAITIIGEHVKVPPPSHEALMQLSSALDNLQPVAAEYDSERQQQTGTRRSKYNDPELVSAATTIVTQMVDSEQFGWADLIESVRQQLDKDDPFITPKQCRAIQRIAAGRRYSDDGSFWDWLSDEYPEASQRLASEAGKA